MKGVSWKSEWLIYNTTKDRNCMLFGWAAKWVDKTYGRYVQGAIIIITVECSNHKYDKFFKENDWKNLFKSIM